MWHHPVLCILFLSFHFQVIFSSYFNFSSPSPNKFSSCSFEESFALLDFKNSFLIDINSSRYCEDYSPETDSWIEYDSYPKTVSWKKGSDCCSWDGVTCDRFTGNVIGLDLSSSQLLGTIHENSSLFLLRHLQKLNLACNELRGSDISSKFGQFTKLTHLSLSSSYFHGLVPAEISHLCKLVFLDLSSRHYSEESALLLELGQDRFNKMLQNLTELRYLHLEDVDMSSVTPGSLVNLSSSFISLSLQNNNLKGRFPDEVFHLPFLRRLGLSQNPGLTGNLPKYNWTSPLRSLSLFNTSFSGELPHTIGNLKYLKLLSIAYSQFEGSIPVSLGNLTRIIYLHLLSNNFSGQFPDIFGNLSSLTELNLRGNEFSGSLPSSMFNLSRLSILVVSLNQFEGEIPCQVSGLVDLMTFDLSYNFLNGAIPFWLFTRQSLQFLYLSNNKLTGPIPNSMFELMNLSRVDLSSNNLSGTVKLDMLSKLQNLESIELSHISLLSLSTLNDTNFTLPKLEDFKCSSCNITQFPIFLRNTHSLGNLDLSNNRIAGQISKWEMELWPNLFYLNLSNNFLTSFDEIPSSMINLMFLDLHSNLLQGPLSFIPTSIWFFSISNNKLTGEIPSSFCNLSSIALLSLSNNSLTGAIPRCLGNLSQLSFLDLQLNNLHGTIPPAFAMSSIQYLNLNGNQLDGPLPPSLANCSELEVVDVGNNKINDTFPHWLASLSELQVLILKSNRFHGPIGSSSTRFPFLKLRILDLSHNRFTGPLPTRYFENFKAMMQGHYNNVEAEYMEFGSFQYYSMTLTIKGVEMQIEKILTIFTSMDLSNNLFQGKIPKVVGNLNSLKQLNFSHNHLTDHIPTSLRNLTELESLDLSSNKLGGEIPMELASLTSLSKLNLSHNQLIGLIPQGKQFNTFQNDSFVGNLGLCGFPLPNNCGDSKAEELGPATSHESNDGILSWFDWKIIMMGYGCGLVIGLSMGYIVFATRRPQWFVRMVERRQSTKVTRLSRRCKGRRNW